MLMLMTIDKGTGMAPFASAQVDVAPILKDHVDNIFGISTMRFSRGWGEYNLMCVVLYIIIIIIYIYT